MRNRVAIGVIIVIFLAGGVYFAKLSRESDRNLQATKQSAISIGTALERERKERKRLEEELKRRNADLEKERATLAQFREASTGHESEILTLREKIADMSASTEGAEKANLSLRREREARAVLEKKLQAKEAALAEERAKATQLAKSLSGFESDVKKLQKAVAGKSAVAAEVSQKLVAMRTSLSELGEQHRAAKVRAMQESMRAQKLRASLETLKKQISGKDLTLKETKDMLQIDIVSRLLFDVGSADIRQEGRDALDKLLGFIKEQKGKLIRVEGHTDNQAIKGALARRYPTNWELSSARAISVVRYLQLKGVPPDRLSATGYSFYRGEASNETPKGRARNRRIAILMSRLKRTP